MSTLSLDPILNPSPDKFKTHKYEYFVLEFIHIQVWIIFLRPDLDQSYAHGYEYFILEFIVTQD